jgi:hypothetical protein
VWSAQTRQAICRTPERLVQHVRSMQTCEGENHRMGPRDLAAAQAPEKERLGEREEGLGLGLG